LRVETAVRVIPTAPEGPTWTTDEADREARSFLVSIAGDRSLVDGDDAVEFARINSLTILFGVDEHASFETYLARMPPDLVDRWRDLLSGGARSEAFGPLTLQEKIDETQVIDALQSGRRQRIVNVAVFLVVLVGAVVGGVVGWNALNDQPNRTSGALRFAATPTTLPGGAVPGGVPAAESALTTGLTRDVAITLGDGPPEDRIVDAPFGDFLYPPGAITASLFSYAGLGEVVFVGPNGFPNGACLIASVATSDLRPLDTVWYGNCLDPIGRRATIRCLGADALVLEVAIPNGAVQLPEGGSGFADALRLQSISDPGTKYEVLSARGTISVAADSEVTIPAFGGAPGDNLAFDLDQGRSGSCTLTDTPIGS